MLPLKRARGVVANFEELDAALKEVLPPLRERGDLEEVEALVERLQAWAAAVADDETATRALLEAASLLVNECGDRRRAVKVWEEAIQRNPHSRCVVRHLRRELAHQCAWAELEALLLARTVAVEATQETGLRHEAWWDLGWARATLMDNPCGAIDAYSRACKALPTRQVHVALAGLLMGRGRAGDVLAATHHFVEAARLSKPGRALPYLRKALSNMPGHGPALVLLRALGHKPSRPKVGLPVAVVQRLRGAASRARQHPTAVRARAPDGPTPPASAVDTVVVPRPRSAWLASVTSPQGLWAVVAVAAVLLLLARYVEPSRPGYTVLASPRSGASPGASAAAAANATGPLQTQVALLSLHLRGTDLSDSAVTAALQPTRRAVARCLREQGQLDAPGTKLELSWTIRRRGNVGHPRFAGGSPGTRTVAHCALRTLRDTRFAHPTNGETTRVHATFGVQRTLRNARR